LAEQNVNPEAAVPKPWWEGRRFRKIAFFVGIPILLWLMFRRTDPVAMNPSPRQVQQANTPVNWQQIQNEQRIAQQQAAEIATKKEQLERLRSAAEAIEGIKTDDIDLDTPQGQAELQNRLNQAQAAKLRALQSSQDQTRQAGQRYGGGSTGESKAEKLRKSLLASAVIYVKDPGTSTPNPSEQQMTERTDRPTQQTADNPIAADKKELAKEKKSLLDLPPDVVSRLTDEGSFRVLPQGTVVQAVLTNKLVGDAAGPVNVMTTVPVYAPGTHEMLMPAGVRIFGEAASVSGFGQSRLGTFFHRALLADGPILYSQSLDTMPGLDQQGAVGLKDKVNQHILSTIAISAVIGGIGGLANIGNYSSGLGSYGGMQQFQSGVSQYMSQSAMQVLNRFLNRQPTVEIRPGTRVDLIWAGDQKWPIFQDAIEALRQRSSLVAQF